MLIKSVSHTAPSSSIKRLIEYVFRPDARGEAGHEVIVTKNLYGNRDEWPAQYDRIESRRRSHYGGKEVKFYHEILSFSPESKPTKSELEDLVRKYLELRLPSPTLACATAHFDTDATHVHVCIQGINLYGKSIRLSKRTFNEQVQQGLEAYQNERYPHLGHSIIQYDKPARERKRQESNLSQKREERTGESSQKKKVVAIIERVFITSPSIESFTGELLKEGIECYYRSGRVAGFYFGGRKWRLKHLLGNDFDRLIQPELHEERLARIKRIRNEQNHDHEKGH